MKDSLKKDITSEMKGRFVPAPILAIKSGEKMFYATLEDNMSAKAFIEKASGIDVEMHDFGGFEKAGRLPWKLPADDKQITASPGDVILYQGDKIAICYVENTRELTRLAKIGNTTKDELLNALGDGDANVKFCVEWSE